MTEKYKTDYIKGQIQDLKNNIFFENESRKLLNYLTPIILNELKPYLDKQILKSGGGFLKKINVNNLIDDRIKRFKVNPLNKTDFVTIRAYLKVNMYSISLDLSLCFNGGNYEDKTYYCVYYDTVKYICDIKGLNIIKFYDYEELKPLNVIEEEKNFLKALELKEQYETQLNKLFYKNKNLVR